MVMRKILLIVFACFAFATRFQEIWSKMGNKSFVAVQPWPVADGKKIEGDALELEDIYKKTIVDIKQVKKLAGKAPPHLCLYFATEKELAYFNESKDHLKKQGFKKVSLYKSSDKRIHDPQNKAKRATYGRPGIYVE